MSNRRKADGEYKLGPASGMVRGLRYGEEDEISEDLMAEFDPNEIGERTEPRSYGHFTQQEYDEISDIFYNPRMARLDDDLARRFGITIKHLNKLLNKVKLAEKFASKIDTVGEKATKRSLVKLKEAIDFHDLMTNADLNFLYRAVEGRLPDTRMASDEYLADFYKESDVDGNYMSVQNIKEIQDMANFLAHQVHNGENMEDWVEDKISSARQMLSDLTRYYSNGEKEMKGLDNWKFAKKQNSAEGGAEGYFADIPYLRETREFAQSGEDTNDPNIDPKAQSKTPPTPSEIEQDDDVKTLGRVKVEEESVKQGKKASPIGNGKVGYIAIWTKGRRGSNRVEIMADSKYEAQKLAVAYFQKTTRKKVKGWDLAIEIADTPISTQHFASVEQLADFYKESVGSYYDGLNRKQRKLLDKYMRQSDPVYYNFDDLPRGLKGQLYDLDDLADEFRYHSGHYQLEESVEIYLRETHPAHNKGRFANDTRPYSSRSATARLLSQWKCLGEE